MWSRKRNVLITGCSDGSLGAALAIAFHEAGLHVVATARNPAKLNQLEARGIETLTLDTLSDSSIAECVSKVTELDILVNNAGSGYAMPVADVSIDEARKCFDLNVWSYIAVSQAFLPLLLKSKGTIVNQTSIASVCNLPFQAAYNASKAAMAAFSDTMRRELKPFGITVVDLKTGNVKTNFFGNQRNATPVVLPKGSIYEPAKDEVEKTLRGERYEGMGMPAEKWAKGVVHDLLKANPPSVIWRGTYAFITRILTWFPLAWTDGILKDTTGLDTVEKILRK
jgi:1-acylglycerone phosphate reductase